MSNVITFTVAVPNAIAQRGRFLAPGETIEIEEHIAQEEFPGRLTYPDGRPVSKPTIADELNTFVASLAGRRAHERVSLLEDKLKALPADSKAQAPLQQLLAQAKQDADADQAVAAKRLADEIAAVSKKPAAPASVDEKTRG